ncbi:3-methyl-2-oxobutanoate dehydrogenase subunit VorB [Pseudothermotoga sp.]|nr:3-methyl-2-oxobutanoate dehydrogenase subunit VorB [Pseudothermotoga sp.]MCX7812749.1 3-methyl-2-oxobutanoate dehydrogenase subunit VorB [Pseudothermotoga sp.]MDW8139029.1 3-methyl-2-oxobutanoate dehydrogenase subunit VorB [Pseudothermotoga sp.]
MKKLMMKGVEAIGEAAIMAGCRNFFGYPITPQNELTEYMARRLPEVGGCFLQAESEVAAVNMIYGAASVGKRAMTSTSSPGFSLMQEGISYMACAQLPAVFVNVMRGGPGLGDIQPSQGDYFQATKGGGHGDYKLIVLAPSTVQEAVELTQLAFELADKYRNPAVILADGLLGQMMEPVELREKQLTYDNSSWALTGANGRPPRKVTSFNIDPHELEKMNLNLQEKYRKMEIEEPRWEEFSTEDAEILLAAYGTMGRICKSVVKMAREAGMKVGLFRPITLYPFPYEPLEGIAKRVSIILTVEMSSGQMFEDVKLAALRLTRVEFYGRMGGVVPTPGEVFERLKQLVGRH